MSNMLAIVGLSVAMCLGLLQGTGLVQMLRIKLIQACCSRLIEASGMWSAQSTPWKGKLLHMFTVFLSCCSCVEFERGRGGRAHCSMAMEGLNRAGWRPCWSMCAGNLERLASMLCSILTLS